MLMVNNIMLTLCNVSQQVKIGVNKWNGSFMKMTLWGVLALIIIKGL